MHEIKMSLIEIVITLLLCCSLTTQRTEGSWLSNGRDINLNKLRKASVKTIQTEYGDIYDCVDFYKQPAFDHPLLKNHTFHPEMKSNSILKEKSPCKGPYEKMKLKDGGCPTGTVPIRRIKKEELYKIRKFTNRYATTGIQPKPGNHFAIVQTNSDPNTVTYSGVGGTFNAFNLSLEQEQYSSGEVIIQNGDEKIITGWTANPAIYKDSQVRLFGYFEAKGSRCFDTFCPGFVATRTDLELGLPMSPLQVRGQRPHYFQLHIHQDIVNGNWWLNVCGIDIGFWPKQIFTTMSNPATYAAIGGETYGPTNRPLPPMGNGYYPVPSLRLSSYCSHLTLVDGNHKIISQPQLEQYTDDPHYGIIDAGDTKFFGRLIFFGGTIVSK